MAIYSLRPEFRPDNARNQVRASQTLARKLYLSGLSAGALWVLYLFVGPLVFLDAGGLVFQDREIVASAYDAQVLFFSARPGEKVAAGQQLGSVVSTQMLDLISNLGTRKGQIESRQAQIAARLAAIEATLPAAESRTRAAKAARASIDKAVAAGFSTSVRAAEASRDAYDAAREVEALHTERSTLQSERAAEKLDLAHVGEALDRARANYRDGVIASPVDGTIGARVAEPGASLSRNEVLAEVYRGKKYVLAYLPTNRMFSVSPGQKVVVTDGVNREFGRVERIETITDRAPPEFQSSFHGVDRNQVARVAFDEQTQFPLLAKIKVTGRFGPSSLIDGLCWALAGRGEAMAAPAEPDAPAGQ
jgi:multidrug resistance efflux pump